MQIALLSSKDQTWTTPEEVLTLIRQLGPIGLDPCPNPRSIVGARESYSLEVGQDGLAEDWLDRGLVYVNPPFGRQLPKWINKAVVSWAQAWECDRSFEYVFLVPARPDTKWFTQAREGATSLGFWRGRIAFGGQKIVAPFPSLLIYFGLHPERFESVFIHKAHIWHVAT